VAFAIEHHDIHACCHVILFPLISPPYARTGQAHAFPVPLCTSCADTGLTAQGSANIIDLTRDSPRANDYTLQRKKVNTKRDAKVEDSVTLAGSKRARGGSARTTGVAALGMVAGSASQEAYPAMQVAYVPGLRPQMFLMLARKYACAHVFCSNVFHFGNGAAGLMQYCRAG